MKTGIKSFINIFKRNLQSQYRIGAFIIIASLCVAACEGKQEQNNSSNVGTTQGEIDVDTTSSAGRGGTTQSSGRANTDTSGTGKASGTSH